MFIKNLEQLPPKPIQVVVPFGIRHACEECGLVETDDLPYFHRHHPMALSKLGFEKWNSMGEERDKTILVCPWCHFEKHVEMEDKIGASFVLNALIAWSWGKVHVKKTYASSE